MKIKAAIFDMDGTLVDSLVLWDVMWSAFGEKYLNDKKFWPSEEIDKKVRIIILKDAMELIHSVYNFGDSGEELHEFAKEIIRDFYANKLELKDGVKEFLEYCKADGVKMCVASATAPDLISVAIDHCQISEYFSKVFSCGDLGKGKDHPDIFLQAAKFLGEEFNDIWVFDDSFTAIKTASKLGMKTVGIYDRFNYSQDKIKQTATYYIDCDETLMKLV